MQRLEFTESSLSRFFNYNSEEGQLYWNAERPLIGMTPQAYGAWKSISSGRVAGTTNSRGKRVVRVSGHTYQVARIVLALHGENLEPGDEISFKDGNPSNVRVENLILAKKGSRSSTRQPEKDERGFLKALDGDYLRQYLRFCKENGLLFWRECVPQGSMTRAAYLAWVGRFSGKPAGAISDAGYRYVTLQGVTMLAHRVIMAMHLGRLESSVEVDHINGNRLDNRLENLRVVTHSINGKNAKRNSRNTSGHVGVYWRSDTNRWAAYGTFNGKTKALGSFPNKSLAISARLKWEKEVGGFTDRHGKEA